MKTLIYATAAEVGGAITILNEYYNEALDSKEEFVFIVSKVNLFPKKNIKIISVPWIKKLWIIRIFFYFILLPKIIKKEKPDKIISLNNTKILIKKYSQSIYLHQALPFLKFKIRITSEPYLWGVKYLIGFLIKYSIKRVDLVIVQSIWLKDILVGQIGISESKVQIKSPKIHFNSKIRYLSSSEKNRINFFYPSGYASYKNHAMIIEAVNSLTEKIKAQIIVKFTLSSNENRYVKKLYEAVIDKNLPIQFIGYQEKNTIQEMYSNHILIFASSVETFGLPLLEAQIAGTPMIVFKSIYSNEIGKTYSKISYFENAEQLGIILSNSLIG